MRSIHLERDFGDESALDGYILTPHIIDTLHTLATGLRAGSSRRAWRITGDYGTGKSSLGLALARLFSGNRFNVPSDLLDAVDFEGLGIQRPHLFPVLITGSRESVSVALLKALGRALLSGPHGEESTELAGRIDKALAKTKRENIDEDALELLQAFHSFIRRRADKTGILIILDELGKFLEFAALYPDRHDVYFLQRLAEVAARSSDTPIFVVGLLHQGFHAYAAPLPRSSQREWEKVAGRFEELLFDQPLEQIADLVAGALNTRIESLPQHVIQEAEQSMERAFALGWYGAGAGLEGLCRNAARLYPLHATALPILIRITKRFAQNERSVFSFLLSSEPSGLQEFAMRSSDDSDFYRLHNLFDYVRSAFGHHINARSYHSHWSRITSLIDSFPAEDDVELQILKTVGLLNLLNIDSFLATETSLSSCLAGADDDKARHVQDAIQHLRDRKVLYYRGIAGGFCLWPHTSVDLEGAYNRAKQLNGSIERASEHLGEYLKARPLVARRHYIETGNLRHFEVRHVAAKDIEGGLEKPTSADGLIIVVLCDTERERQEAIERSQTELFLERTAVLVAIPRPLRSLNDVIEEARNWQWVRRNTPELNHDAYAAEEVSRQVEAARYRLAQRVGQFVGLTQPPQETEIRWFRKGEPLPFEDGRQMLSYLSEVCNDVYHKSPRIFNELINRKAPSSAAAAARNRLIEGILEHSSEPLLGISPKHTPPEKAMYLSILRRGRLHRARQDESYSMMEPEPEKDPCNLQPALEQIRTILQSRPKGRASVPEIFEALRHPPFGIRDGLMEILLVTFAKIHEQDIAFYERGSFIKQITPNHFRRLNKSPDLFEVQYCQIAGIRTEVYDKLFKVIGVSSPESSELHLLDVVTPLCLFVAQLPAYAHSTQRISERAQEVRSTLLSAREPAPLLFEQLPRACGFEPFETNEQETDTPRVRHFVDALKGALDELRAAYPHLVERIKDSLENAFNTSGSTEQLRKVLGQRAAQVSVAVRDRWGKAFCLRLADEYLSEEDWLESIGSLVVEKPPSKWEDDDEEAFRENLEQYVQKFLRIESTVFATKEHPTAGQAIRIGLTRSDGSEVQQVLYVSDEEKEELERLETRITSALGELSRLEIAAVSRVIWKALSGKSSIG